jgi:DNA mismatch repair protein MLH3
MSIQALPPDVVAQIKSSTTITSLNGVIFELVQNCLDAEATKIDINVDYARGGCIVEDDGLGILPTEFGENGGLGKLYRGYSMSSLVRKLIYYRYIQAG